MKKILLFFTLILTSAILLSADALPLMTEGSQQTIPMSKGSVTFKCQKDSLTVIMECPSDVLPALKKKYAKLQWDVFAGENMDLTFSPYGGWPAYRLRLNPSGKFFCSFYGTPKWESVGFQGTACFTDNGWRATIVLPYAALESDESPVQPKSTKPRMFLPSPAWTLNVSRNAMTPQGTRETIAPAGVVPGKLETGIKVKIDEKLLLPYRRIALRSVAVPVVSAEGKGQIKGSIHQADKTIAPISGKIHLYLHEDKDVKEIAQCDFAAVPGQNVAFTIPFTIEETGSKLAMRLTVTDAEGTILRESRILRLVNPWAE